MADDNPSFEELRNAYKEQQKQLRAATQELDELRSYRQHQTFREAGYDPESGPGKALLKLHDGEFTVDAIRETAATYGLGNGTTDAEPGEPLPAATQQRMAAQEQINDATAHGTPTAPRMSYEEFQKARSTDPQAAGLALRNGNVDLPPHVARQLDHNRNNTPIGR